MKRALLHIRDDSCNSCASAVFCRVSGEVAPVPLHPDRQARQARQARPTCSVMDGEVTAVPHPELVHLLRVTFHQLKGSD